MSKPRRLSDWKRLERRAVEALKNDEWWDGKDWRPKGTYPRTAAEGMAYRTAKERIAEITSAVLGGTAQCIDIEFPPDHIPLYERVSPEGGVVRDCSCSGCEAVRSCKCPACRAVQRFARSSEADRNERSASTCQEAEAELIFAAARPYLRRKPYNNRPGFTDEPAQRTAWTALARYISAERKEEVTPNRLRMICRQRGEK